MIDHAPHSTGLGKAIVLSIGCGILAIIALHWSWNTFMVEIVGLKQLAFKHSVALFLLLMLVAGALGWVRGGGRRDRDEVSGPAVQDAA